MMTEVKLLDQAARGTGARQQEGALDLALRLPSLIVAAKEVAASLMHGVHGRRRAGPGETFWQFRPFLSGEPAARVDWRRSARENHAFVREREWEASHTVWIWFDRTASMAFASDLAPTSKIDRAAVLALALADLAVGGDDRAGLIGLTRPMANRAVIERFAEAIAADEKLRGASRANLPSVEPVRTRSKVVLIGAFLAEADEITRVIRALASHGAEGQILMISD